MKLFLDITATRKPGYGCELRTARMTSYLYVGGDPKHGGFPQAAGRRGLQDINKLRGHCGTKRSYHAAEEFGSQCVVVAIDAKAGKGGGYEVYINGGSVNTGIDAVSWAIEAEKLGAGEILLTSIDADGTKAGFDVQMVRAVADAVKIPCTASGGGGSLEHFAEVFEKGHADAALAASCSISAN